MEPPSTLKMNITSSICSTMKCILAFQPSGISMQRRTEKALVMVLGLQASSKDPILTADALYQWANKNLVETLVFFSLKENHAITAQELNSRFASANTVPGTQKDHSFVPSAVLTLMLRKYSASLECDVFLKKTVRQRRKRSAHSL